MLGPRRLAAKEAKSGLWHGSVSMSLVEMEPLRWAEQQFGECELGDSRRTERAVLFAAQIAAGPDASTPAQTEHWSDLKAAYRLIDEEDVTFAALANPHWQLTRNRESGTYLILGDTTEVNFGWHRKIRGASRIGSSRGQGFLLHSGLMVEPRTRAVIGLAGQVIRHRVAAPRGENSSQKLKRDRESLLWGQLVEQIGPPPADVQFIHVFDRGADNFEVFCRVLDSRGDFVIRAAMLHRKVFRGERELTLDQRLAELPVADHQELAVSANKNQPKRIARISIRYGSVTLKAPKHRSPWLQERGTKVLDLHVVELRETRPPRGVTPLRWVLFTSLPVHSLSAALRVIEHYEQRWLIEEFHKALKTGCRAEERGYQTAARLETITALLSVTAVRLLQLRSLARTEPTRPAAEVVPKSWITMLSSLRRGKRINTVREFFRELAGLGGFLGRKHDGGPGWITTWRGYEKLQFATRALHDYRQRCG